jgi:multidrug efflux system outer membrane protein
MSLAPRYERPPAPIPAQLAGGSGDARAADLAWQAFVRDPKLRAIVARALADNRDLRRAAQDIEAARARYRIQRAQQLPAIDANVSATFTRQIVVPGQPAVTYDTYFVGVGLSAWEIDLFGRLKNLTAAQLHAYLSTVELAKAARISLIGELASAYATLAADRSRLAIAQRTMELSKRTMDLTEQLVGGGASSRGDYWQAATVFETARGDVALLTATIAQDRDALELLAGGTLDDALLPDALPDALDWLADVPVGLSSAVLLDRPDVAAAEHDLQAANADIGAARAQLFPSLTLTGNGGVASVGLASLFTSPAAVFTIAPNLLQPLFHGGALRANVAQAEAHARALVAAYELAIQRAFREVADALATRATIDEQLAAQAALLDASQKAFELAQARYKEGIDPFLATLVAQRALYTAENAMVATRLSAAINRVTLYRALGGGLK